MCYFNGQRVTREEFIRLKALEREVKKYDFLNEGVVDGFTQKPLAVLVPSGDEHGFDIVPMEWGYIPSYNHTRADVEQMRKGYMGATKWIAAKPNLNAKAENLFKSPTKDGPSVFIDGVRYGRCLVLSTGFFEFRHIKKRHKKTGKLLESKEAYPYFISLKDHSYFYMAGVYTPWEDELTGEKVNSVAIVTTEANIGMKAIHNEKERMPTILNEDLGWKWMMEDLTDNEIREIAATQYDWEQMQYCTVSKQFKASLTPEDPFSFPELPALELAIAGDPAAGEQILLSDNATKPTSQGSLFD